MTICLNETNRTCHERANVCACAFGSQRLCGCKKVNEYFRNIYAIQLDTANVTVGEWAKNAKNAKSTSKSILFSYYKFSENILLVRMRRGTRDEWDREKRRNWYKINYTGFSCACMRSRCLLHLLITYFLAYVSITLCPFNPNKCSANKMYKYMHQHYACGMHWIDRSIAGAASQICWRQSRLSTNKYRSFAFFFCA